MDVEVQAEFENANEYKQMVQWYNGAILCENSIFPDSINVWNNIGQAILKNISVSPNSTGWIKSMPGGHPGYAKQKYF